jgi:hypothetical protein
MQYHIDPNAEKRSVMLKQPSFCNGEATGFACKHYWTVIMRVDVQNPDHLRTGEKVRRCLVIAPEIIELGDGTRELAVHCSRYEQDTNRPYDPDFEEYNPMSPEEIDALKEEQE